MALLHQLSVVAVLGLAYAALAATDLAAQAAQVAKEGDALPDALQKGWTARLADQKKNLSAAKEALQKNVAADVKAGVTNAVQQYEKVINVASANLTAFAKLQNTDAKKIAQDYAKLLKASSASESEIHQLRNTSQQTVNAWVAKLGQLHADAHSVLQSTIDSIAESIAESIAKAASTKASSTKAPDAAQAALADRTRVAAIQVGVGLLNALVQEQNADIFLLTSTQFGMYNSFFSKAETVLLQRMVEAKSSQHAAGQSPTGQSPAGQNPAGPASKAA